MSKAHVTELLSEFLEGGLSYANAEKVKAHLAFCNRCRQELEEFKHQRAVLRATPDVPPPEGLESRVLTAVRNQHEPMPMPVQTRSGKFVWPSWFTPMRGLALAVTCGVVLVVVRNLPKSARARGAFPTPARALLKDQGQAPVAIARRAVAPAPEKPVAPPEAAPTAPRAAPPSEAFAPPNPKVPDEEDTGSDQAASAMRSAPVVEAKKAVPMAAVATVNSAVGARPSATPLEGSQSAIGEPRELVIKDKDVWQALWKEHMARMPNAPPAPDIDFEHHDVIAIFAGQRPTGGYRIMIDDVSTTTWNGEAARVVRYHISSPPAGVITTQVITTPYLFSIQPHFSGQTFIQKNR